MDRWGWTIAAAAVGYFLGRQQGERETLAALTAKPPPPIETVEIGAEATDRIFDMVQDKDGVYTEPPGRP